MRWVIWVGAGVLLAMEPAVGDAVVALTSNVTTVAEGGTINFTVTVTPSTYVSQVTLSYAGESGQDQDSTEPYTFSHQFNTPGDNILVTATVTYNNGDPNGQATEYVNVIGLTLTGNASPMRGTIPAYVAQSNPTGKTVTQFNWTYTWSGGSASYQDNNGDGDDRSTWSGKMAVSGTMTCTATISGVSPQKSKVITVAPRSWTVAITCAQDNESGWGDTPTAYAALGQHRDRDSDASDLFVPRGTNRDWSPAYTLAQVSVGPCTGWWYVSGCTLKVQQETVINRYIKSDGPALGGYNFYTMNSSSQYGCFTSSPDDFILAAKNHEHRGTPDTAKSVEGHHGRTEKPILDDNHDAKKNIEGLTSGNLDSLKLAVYDTINADETAVGNYAGDEDYMTTYGPNWGSTGGLGYGMNSRWDSNGSVWTDCVNAPDSF